MEHKSEMIREMNCKMRNPEEPTSPCEKLKRRSTSHVRSKLNSRALDTEGRNEFKNLYPSYQKRNIRKQASGDIISEDYTQTFVDYDTHQRKHSYTTRIMNKTRKQNPCNSLIGYIDYLGIFRCDVDPERKNGYIKEEIESDGHLLPMLFSRDEVSEWRKDIAFAWEILKGVYQSLKWCKNYEEEVIKKSSLKLCKYSDKRALNRVQMLILPFPEKEFSDLHHSIHHIEITSLNNPINIKSPS
ncbi:unnamed protein product [Moneuplotes crassus]|uniref:Uncharacterized protein n=1 Tax=Euplotes crassus TaxID=5936 RepID=A0AAD1Y779_EUPCR|nr:unnamed protein product [Moneuplotes crassus]